jgi:hypothetical protein
MAEIERGELLNSLMPFALYYENKIKNTMAQLPGNTPLFDGAFTIDDFLGPWMIMHNDDQGAPVFDAVVKDQAR